MLDKPIIYSMVISIAINLLGYVYYHWKFHRGIMTADLCKWRYFLFTLVVSCYAGLFLFRSLSNVMPEAVSPVRSNELVILLMHVILIIPFMGYARRNMGHKVSQ